MTKVAGKQEDVLLFGVLPPGANKTAAATVQTAIALAADYSVTVVIADTAPPPAASSHYKIARERDIIRTLQAHAGTPRLFVMGNNYESLFALDWYLANPAPILLAEDTAALLIKDHYATSPNWPENYANWLVGALGAEGEKISHALLQHRRFSDTILNEIPDTEPALATAPLTADHIFNPAVAITPAGPSSLDRRAARRALGCDDDKLLLLYTAGGAAEDACKTFKDLEHGPSMHMVSGAEENLAELVTAADFVLVTEQGKRIPSLACLALEQQKPLITASQHWVRILPPSCVINLAQAEALHQLVAAIGALSKDEVLRNWYSNNMAALRTDKNAVSASGELGRLKKRLAEAQPPTSVPSANKEALHNSNSGAAQPNPHPATEETTSLKNGPARSVALVGAVPPRSLVEKLFPEVDWETSPRFATRQTATTLCADNLDYAANKLALLGYDSPLIETAQYSERASEQNTTPNLKTESWADVQTELKATSEVLAFGCTVAGAVSADAIIAAAITPNYDLLLEFDYRASSKSLSYYSENCGLFWHLDPIRHHISCTLVAGLRGRYQLNLQGQNHQILITDAMQTTPLNKGKPVVLRADSNGILSFIVIALDSTTYATQKYEFLLKTLAECKLNLEWLDHG